MRTYEEYRAILVLWEQGFNKSEIAQMIDIPRCTVRDCVNKFGDLAGLTAVVETQHKLALLNLLQDSVHLQLQETYAYVLGLYLGDGHLVKAPRAYKLRFFLDAKYPQIIERCYNSLQTLLPDNSPFIVKNHVGEGTERYLSSVEVACYYTHWAAIFPQHGEGLKHLRKIELTDWQERIVAAYPLEFFRGLYHSDGSRSQNISKGKDYPRYFFTNMSEDIRNLYIQACERLKLHWKYTNARNIAISQREDVAWLDEHVGAKA